MFVNLNSCNSTSQFISILFLCSCLFSFSHQIKNFLFLLWVNLYMITGTYLHDPYPFNGPFFMTPPFSESQKLVTLPLFPPPSPLLISDTQSKTQKHMFVSHCHVFMSIQKKKTGSGGTVIF